MNSLLERIKGEIEKRGIDATPMLVGSVAKGTHLKNPDLDIFILFSVNYSREEIEKYGMEIGYAILPNAIAKYAEHPYLRGKFMGFDVDIVPSYHVERADMKITAVDRTPFHTEYVKNHLNDYMRDEVRILKAFMKGIGVYGAEAKVQGFSGYLCELLVIKYGSFMNVIKNAARWKKKVHLSLGSGDFKKFSEPLVVIDPVDPGRNVASAVSEKSKSLMTFASKQFLKNASIKFFFPNELNPMSMEELRKKLEERGSYIYAVILPKPDIIDDMLYPQMRRTMDAFVSILKSFVPLNNYYFVDTSSAYFIVELERDTLPVVKKHEGPPVWTENALAFYEKWKGKALRGPYIEGYRIYADVERKYRTVEEVLRKGVENYKLGKHFDIKKKEMKIVKITDALDHLDKRKLTEFIKYLFPWDR